MTGCIPEPWASTVYLRRLCVDPGVDPGVDPCRRPASTYVDPLGRRFYVCRRRPASTCVDRLGLLPRPQVRSEVQGLLPLPGLVSRDVRLDASQVGQGLPG